MEEIEHVSKSIQIFSLLQGAESRGDPGRKERKLKAAGERLESHLAVNAMFIDFLPKYAAEGVVKFALSNYS